MEDNYWVDEYWRIGLVILVGVIIGLIFGQWVVGFFLGLMGYVFWVLYKLYELQKWISSGAPSDAMPDSNGVWEQIAHLINKDKLAEQRNKKKRRELIRRFNTLVGALPDAVMVLEGNNTINWANSASYTLLNIHDKKDIGQRVDNLIRAPELKSLLEKPKPKKELDIQLAHNDSVRVGVRIVPLKGGQKVLIARDVSEERRLQQSRRSFIANASHELRTPLTVVRGYLEILEDSEIPEVLKPAVQSAGEQAQRMELLIADLLALSRLENTGVVKGKVVKMTDIIVSVCHDAEQTVAKDKYTITQVCDKSLKVWGSQKEIESVVHNLIFNAIKHTDEGSEIKVSWKQEADMACFAVRDNGPGIPNDDIPHLTERFYRADSGRTLEKEGTGLGLSIVKHVMQRHNGDLHISSELGVGSTFTACFPVL